MGSTRQMEQGGAARRLPPFARLYLHLCLPPRRLPEVVDDLEEMILVATEN